MFFYSSKFPGRVEYQNLANLFETYRETYYDYVKQATKWITDEWDHLYGYSGFEAREKHVHENKNGFFIVTYTVLEKTRMQKDIPIGFFALLDTAIPKFKELWGFYVDQRFRDCGLGRRMIEEVKKIANKAGFDIFLDTMRPQLNRFYLKNGAEIVGGKSASRVDDAYLVFDCSKPTDPRSSHAGAGAGADLKEPIKRIRFSSTQLIIRRQTATAFSPSGGGGSAGAGDALKPEEASTL